VFAAGWGWGEGLDMFFDLWFFVAMLVDALLVASESADKVKEKKSDMAKQFWRHTFPLYFFPSVFIYIFTSYDTSVWVGARLPFPCALLRPSYTFAAPAC
jgi:hypothetical protein